VDSDPPPSALAGALTLPTPAAWLDFVRDHLPRLQAAGWQIDYGGDYRYDIAAVDDWYADLNEDDEDPDGWFALELGVLVNGARYPLLPLLLEMIRRAPEDFDAQALAARDDASELLVDLSPSTRVALPWARIKPILATLGELYFAERMGDGLRLPVIDAARLAELDAAAQMRWLGGERLRELGRKLGGFDGVHAVAAPAGLQAQLRPYQLSGLAWMQFLREYGFGGILADDMGLGKTIQTLAHILAEKEAGRLDAPALVVAPTSLMGNWQAEAARFAPGLRVLLLHGKDRKESFDQVAGADIVLTTYALLGRDEDALRRHRYHLLILDEAQYIKNSRAKAAQVVRLLDARHRLCLTGTPVQNHLGELWSQFHFLMPGLLGNEKTFNAHYRKPIEGRGDTLRKDLLVRRLKPFMLRRTKDRVATELPPKTEIVLPVDFGAAQRDLYETVRLAMDRKVRDEIDRKGLARSQIVILDALLKLRQVCCDPRLLKGGAAAGSGKLEALMELLDTLLSEGRKVLVFSQFTSMLALIEAELRARAVAYALLTGDTSDRDAQVADFQQGRVGVFLISLKAGGVGLNLTAADTVIHYDPWWNPASENQATDRAWRIGQTQPVFVYKLIARGTLEEKIQDMQRRKGDLANALLDSGEADVSLKLGADDLQAIFAPL
jgi:SNF2 family DNA or RNA helicase